MDPSPLTEAQRFNSALGQAVRPQTAAPVRKTLSQGEVQKLAVHDRLYLALSEHPMDFNSLYRESDYLSLESYRRQPSALGSKCPSFDTATFCFNVSWAYFSNEHLDKTKSKFDKRALWVICSKA
jgi:hypothetical protein